MTAIAARFASIAIAATILFAAIAYQPGQAGASSLTESSTAAQSHSDTREQAGAQGVRPRSIEVDPVVAGAGLIAAVGVAGVAALRMRRN
jgi:hypothetical protein